MSATFNNWEKASNDNWFHSLEGERAWNTWAINQFSCIIYSP